MFTKGLSKKAVVLALAGMVLSVYLFGVIAIAQTTDKVVLTPEAMSQIVGGACTYCDVQSAHWSPSCSYASCSSPSDCSPSSATWVDPSDVCKPTLSKRVCWSTGSSGYREYYYNCDCIGNNCLPVYTGQHSGVSLTCSDQSTNSC